MFISLSTWIYDHLGISEMIRRVKKCGYSNVEISGFNWRKKWRWKEILKESKKNKIEIVSIHCLHHEFSDDRFSFDFFKDYHEKFYKSIVVLNRPVIVEHGVGKNQSLQNKQLIK